MSDRRCGRCGARLRPPGAPCQQCGALPVQVETSLWSRSDDGLDWTAGAGAGRDRVPPADREQPGPGSPNSRVLVLAVAGVLVLAAGGLAVGLAFDSGGDGARAPTSTAVLPVPIPAPDVPTTPFLLAVPPATVVVPAPSRSFTPIGAHGLLLDVWVEVGATDALGSLSSYAEPVAISFDLDTGLVSGLHSSTRGRPLPRGLQPPVGRILRVYDTDAGLWFLTSDVSGNSLRLHPADWQWGQPSIDLGDAANFVVVPDGTVWVHDPVSAELRRYAYGAVESAERRSTGSGSVARIVGADLLGEPVAELRDGNVVIVDRLGAAQPVAGDVPEVGRVHGVRGDVVVRTRCGADLVCASSVEGPGWPSNSLPLVHAANISPRGDAVVFDSDQGLMLFASIDEAPTPLANPESSWLPVDAAAGGSWTADGSYYVVQTDRTTMVVWEVDVGGLTWFQVPSGYEIMGLIGVVPHPR